MCEEREFREEERARQQALDRHRELDRQESERQEREYQRELDRQERERQRELDRQAREHQRELDRQERERQREREEIREENEDIRRAIIESMREADEAIQREIDEFEREERERMREEDEAIQRAIEESEREISAREKRELNLIIEISLREWEIEIQRRNYYKQLLCRVTIQIISTCVFYLGIEFDQTCGSFCQLIGNEKSVGRQIKDRNLHVASAIALSSILLAIAWCLSRCRKMSAVHPSGTYLSHTDEVWQEYGNRYEVQLDRDGSTKKLKEQI
jgi:hypothetical protein